MKIQTFYRCAVWVPLLVPGGIALAVYWTGLPPSEWPAHPVVQMLLASGIYGGLPYLALAVYATWWIDDRDESEIRRRALQAPLWMTGAWLPVAAIFGLLSGSIEMFAGLAGLGTAVIIPLGYAYVASTIALRHVAGRPKNSQANSPRID